MAPTDQRAASSRRDPRGSQIFGHGFALPDAQVGLVDSFLAPEEASSFFHKLLAGIRWRQDTITMGQGA
jgi:hypothetical protein